MQTPRTHVRSGRIPGRLAEEHSPASRTLIAGGDQTLAIHGRRQTVEPGDDVAGDPYAPALAKDAGEVAEVVLADHRRPIVADLDIPGPGADAKRLPADPRADRQRRRFAPMLAVAHANPCAIADVVGIRGLAGVGTDPGPDPFEGHVLAGVVHVADPKDRAVARKRVIALPQPADDAVAVAGVPEAVAHVAADQHQAVGQLDAVAMRGLSDLDARRDARCRSHGGPGQTEPGSPP